MNSKGKIKVIKKGALPVQVRAERIKVSKQAHVREMVGNVTAWVSEFQNRKGEEAKQAFEQLFGPQNPQTTGA
jgi:hypothetical protein